MPGGWCNVRAWDRARGVTEGEGGHGGGGRGKITKIIRKIIKIIKKQRK